MILISGGTGLVGAHLLYALIKQKKQAVKAICRNFSSTKITKETFSYYTDGLELFDKIEWVEGDIMDVGFLDEVMQNVSYVYHCAAMVSFKSRDKNKLMSVNIEGTANMVNVALSKNIKKFCHVSSIASFGRTKRNEKVTENTNWENNGTPANYSLSKYHAENEVWRASEEGLDVVIVNPSCILGSGNWERGSSELFKKVWKGLPFYTKGVNGFVDVIDVVNCMIQLMESPIKNERYLLVSENLTFEALFNNIAHNLKKKPPYIHVGQTIASISWRIDKLITALTGKNPLVTKETARISLDKQHYSNEKIKSAIHYEFIPIKQTIERVSQDLIKTLT